MIYTHGYLYLLSLRDLPLFFGSGSPFLARRRGPPLFWYSKAEGSERLPGLLAALQFHFLLSPVVPLSGDVPLSCNLRR